MKTKLNEQTKQPEYDEAIMNELLSQPTVRKSVLRMKASELAFFKELLVSQGIYAQYVKEREEEVNGNRL